MKSEAQRECMWPVSKEMKTEREVVTYVLNRKPVQLPSKVNCQFNTQYEI